MVEHWQELYLPLTASPPHVFSRGHITHGTVNCAGPCRPVAESISGFHDPDPTSKHWHKWLSRHGLQGLSKTSPVPEISIEEEEYPTTQLLSSKYPHNYVRFFLENNQPQTRHHWKQTERHILHHKALREIAWRVDASVKTGMTFTLELTHKTDTICFCFICHCHGRESDAKYKDKFSQWFGSQVEVKCF